MLYVRTYIGLFVLERLEAPLAFAVPFERLLHVVGSEKDPTESILLGFLRSTMLCQHFGILATLLFMEFMDLWNFVLRSW